MVKVSPEADPDEVAESIDRSVSGVSAITSPELFATFRSQMQAQRTGMIVILAVILVLALGIIMLVYSMVINHRRREIGVLRALGATRAAVLRSLLAPAALLALVGGVAGVILGGLVVFFFRSSLSDMFGFPFTFPSAPDLVALIVVGLAVAVAAVLLAAFVPAYRVGRQDPALSMRE